MTTAIAKAAAHRLFEELDSTISLDGQDVNFTALLKVDGHKVRLRIRSNAYAFQSHAYADVWSPADLQWHNIAEVGHGSMKTPKGMYVWRADGNFGTWNNPAIFAADASRLLELVATVLL